MAVMQHLRILEETAEDEEVSSAEPFFCPGRNTELMKATLVILTSCVATS